MRSLDLFCRRAVHARQGTVMQECGAFMHRKPPRAAIIAHNRCFFDSKKQGQEFAALDALLAIHKGIALHVELFCRRAVHPRQGTVMQECGAFMHRKSPWAAIIAHNRCFLIQKSKAWNSQRWTRRLQSIKGLHSM